MPRRTIRVSSRFWRKVDRSAECWLWTGARTAQGYGALSVGGKSVAAHRVSWLLSRGTLPEGNRIGHVCASRLCVRPEHLHAVAPSAEVPRYAPLLEARLTG